MSATINISRNVISKSRRNRLIDIDGTICDDIDNENSHLYPYARPYDGAVEKINGWYYDGDLIVFFTAREEKDRQATVEWLDENGFKYDYLLMGKPRGNGRAYYWLDNLEGQFEQYKGSWKEVRG
jgi:hypothetical protein